jgi:hypothetical protein
VIEVPDGRIGETIRPFARQEVSNGTPAARYLGMYRMSRRPFSPEGFRSLVVCDAGAEVVSLARELP